MLERSKSEIEEQRVLEDRLRRPEARDTALERMAREAVHQHRAGRTELVPRDGRDEPPR